MLYPSHWGGKSTELPFFAASTLALANRHHHPRTVFTTSTTALASLTTFVSLGRIQLAACPNLARKQRFFPLQRRALRTFAVARTLLLRAKSFQVGDTLGGEGRPKVSRGWWRAGGQLTGCMRAVALEKCRNAARDAGHG